MEIKKQIRQTPQVGTKPYRQVHAHSTANPKSTAQNEADYMSNKDLNGGFYTHVVGNGQVIQTAEVNRGAWDVGGGWNSETYAAVELIESHKTRAEFERDYKLYCELLKSLAKEAGIPVTVDTGDVAGIKSHDYCTHHQPANKSDHVDPYPYLAKWGITREQFAKDVSGAAGTTQPTTPGNTGSFNSEDLKMNFFFKEGDAEAPTYYYYEAGHIKHVTNPDTLKVLRVVTKDANGGKALKEYDWTGNNPSGKLLRDMFK